ncbi:hypothetical protein [uncultured Selenomonas sp.]|uniref:hypothetical protein n=1 Tax=uncultured Selenomonas sp. TaxID=159275 RepID=UPI0025E7A52C|nr:hypothetical protein [uncultured Selenomonas sp.]
MSFKYYNPGYPNLFDTAGGTSVTDTALSRTGVSFWQASSSLQSIKFKSIPQEIFCKFDFFLHYDEQSDTDYDIYVRTSWPYSGVAISKTNRYSKLIAYVSGDDTQIISTRDELEFQNTTHLIRNQVNSIFFHFKLSDDAGTYELYANGMKLKESTGRVSLQSSPYLTFASTKAVAPLSGIILSDTAFDRRESILRLPTSGIETDMKANEDGTYTASAAGQTLLQTVDAAAMVDAYGGASKVTGFLTVAYPAYRTEDGLDQLTQVMKKDGVLTDCGSASVGKETTGLTIVAHEVDMTVADLAGVQVGWKAGA